jgi:hypothetical protein
MLVLLFLNCAGFDANHRAYKSLCNQGEQYKGSVDQNTLWLVGSKCAAMITRCSIHSPNVSCNSGSTSQPCILVESEGIEPSSEQVNHNAFYMLSRCWLSGWSRSATYLRPSVYALKFHHNITYLL